MSTNNEVFGSLAKNTIKGVAIHALAAAMAGVYSVSVLTLSGAGVNGDNFTLGGDVYELLQVNTDTNTNTANGELANAVAGYAEITLSGQSVGRVLRVENEFLLVVKADDTTCTVLRGFAGSTVASHANGVDIFRSAAASTAGRKVIPVGATLTNTTVAPLITLAVNYHVAGYYAGLGKGAALVRKASLDVEAVNFSTTAVAFLLPGGNSPLPTVAESVTNGTITNFTAGVPVASALKSENVHTVTAADVTATVIRAAFPFAAKVVTARVYTAAGALKAWDGAVTLSAGGRVATIDNAGTTDWAATDYILISAYA